MSLLGSGGRIRTSDLWVMSPTSCLCSTPRYHDSRSPELAGRPQRPRLPQRYHCSTLRRCAGSRPGSGWDRVGPTRSRPRAPRKLQIAKIMSVVIASTIPPRSPQQTQHQETHTPSIIRTTWLQSVASCPPVAYLPSRLLGISRNRSSRDVSS